MVDPCHKPFPRTTCTLQFTSCGTCAFRLEISHQAFPSDSLLFHTPEELAVTLPFGWMSTSLENVKQKMKFYPSLNGRQRKYRPVVSYRSTSRKIISDRQFLGYFWFGLCLLDHFTGLGNGIDHQLRLKFKALLNLIVTASL